MKISLQWLFLMHPQWSGGDTIHDDKNLVQAAIAQRQNAFLPNTKSIRFYKSSNLSFSTSIVISIMVNFGILTSWWNPNRVIGWLINNS